MRLYMLPFIVLFVASVSYATPALIVPPAVAGIEASASTVVFTGKPPVRSYSYKELKRLAEQRLNRKLALKEKLVLLLVKKKLNKAIRAAPFPENTTDKNQILAALLCFSFGALGVHDFYLGTIGSGIGKLFLLGVGLTGILIYFPFIALAIWIMADILSILTNTKKPKRGEYRKKL